MAPVTLLKLLKKNSPLASVLHSLAGLDEDVCIEDIDGARLWGSKPGQDAERFEINLSGRPIGWVAGGQNPAVFASLLSYTASQEDEKKSLAAELLDRYRELNLLYRLSEILGASPYPEAIASAALESALRIIPAQSGQILLKPERKSILQEIARCGSPFRLVPDSLLVERVLSTGKAELTNDAPGEELFFEIVEQCVSVVCAPLKTEKNMLGVILLASPAERVFTAGDLKLLNTIAQQAAPIIEISRLYQIELEKARLERDLEVARQVQQSLLPQKPPQIPGWQFDQRWHPARKVSGDFYDVIKEGPQRLGLVTADVTDKGMGASLFMVFVRSALRASITRRATPDRVLTTANRVICQDSHEGLFATLFYARLDTESGKLDYGNAGHPPALLYRRAQDEIQFLARTGIPLGVDGSSTYTYESLQLESGDFILFYTDGMIEAEDETGREFGLERLKGEVFSRRQASTSQLLDGLEQALSAYTSPLPVQDDLTLLVVRRE